MADRAAHAKALLPEIRVQDFPEDHLWAIDHPGWGYIELPQIPRYLLLFVPSVDGEIRGRKYLLGLETEAQLHEQINRWCDTHLEFYLKIYDLEEGVPLRWRVFREIELEPLVAAHS